jgi:hypothetical protein
MGLRHTDVPTHSRQGPDGSGERFLGDIDLVRLGYSCTEYAAGERATHAVLGRHT